MGLVTTMAAEGRLACKPGAVSPIDTFRAHNCGRQVHSLDVGDKVALRQAELSFPPINKQCMPAVGSSPCVNGLAGAGLTTMYAILARLGFDR